MGLRSSFSPSLLAVCAIAGCTVGREPPRVITTPDASFPDTGLQAMPDAMPPRRDVEVPPVDAPPLMGEVLVYAHSKSTLFSFDPRSLRVASLGEFYDADHDEEPEITDIAITKDGEIYGCSRDALYRIDDENAASKRLAEFDLPEGVSFNGLTFVPMGELENDRETLVGATDDGEDGTYYRIDLETGATREIGRYSNGYRSSGDIVSVEGAGTFATVKRDDLDTDLLVRIDLTTGRATRIGDGIGYRRIFGLAYFRDRLYGFVADGTLVQIDLDTGVGDEVSTTTGTMQFWGAGVTTLAPVGPF